MVKEEAIALSLRRMQQLHYFRTPSKTGTYGGVIEKLSSSYFSVMSQIVSQSPSKDQLG
jgi:hypothetical protein